MSGRDYPVPVWNSETRVWEPVEFRNGQVVVQWPAGFDPANLPIPEYSEGDRIQFVRDETCAREGIIRRVLLQGNSQVPLQELYEVAKSPSFQVDRVTYIVTARGHDHRITAAAILGRFISLERISRILPLQE